MNLIKERVLKEASYIIKTKKTIRDLAKKYKLSKSTIHNDLTTKLKKIDKILYARVQNIFSEHKEVRHINGGNATKMKYQVLKNKKSEY